MKRNATEKLHKRNPRKILLGSLICLICLVLLTVGILAYYEYYGQYSSIITLNGQIRLDAFDVLYEEFRSSALGYGTTPENPYVIDSVRRLQNLIKLNNSGKLKQYKQTHGVEKYYFCLEFDQTELPQVLNLLDEGLFSTIGNNQYPFEDELSGIVYAYEIAPDVIVYYSGCLDTVIVTIKDGYIYRDGVNSGILASTETEGIYLKLDRTYHYDAVNGLSFTANTTYLPLERFTVVHQMIANATIVADDTQLDIGFFNHIAATGDVHDVILYNTSILCQEDVSGQVHGNLFTLFTDLLNGTSGTTGALTTHNTAQDFAEEDYRDERHIGIFAGHIDGNASNISIGGLSTISIGTDDVNYYSQYTTVGFISDTAHIGGVLYEELVADMSAGDGNVSGCMFADYIYSAAANQSGLVAGTINGIQYYRVDSIDASTTHNWGGVDSSVGNGVFSYGSFHFLLSSGSDDIVNNLWANKAESTLLYEQGYSIYQSVLYCADEYRYSADGQPTGALVNGAATVDESKYSSIGKLESTGSVLDAGKYLITAYVNRNGVDHYYALKLTAEAIGDSIVCSFDTTDDCDVTAFINSDDTSTTIYSSTLWTIDTASETPTFVNSRFEGNYLKWDYDSQNLAADIAITTNSAQKTPFIYSSANNALYFEQDYELAGGGFGTYRYYLTFNYETGTWSMTSNLGAENTTSTIKLYKVSNGYTVKRVDDLSELVPNNDYVIVAYDSFNNKFRLLGIDAELDSETEQWLIGTGFANPDMTFDTMPTSVSVDEYDRMQNYIWYTESAAGGVCTFTDRISTDYGLQSSDGLGVSTAAPASWTYSAANHTLTSGG